MLSHLVYISVRQPQCTEEEITKILQSCQKNNAQLDVTGVLLFSKTQFVQYLEGEYKTIIGLYDKIKVDSRHKNAVLISSSQITERVFPSWQMGEKRFDEKTIDVISGVSASEKAIFTSILDGKTQEGTKALDLIKKLFK